MTATLNSAATLSATIESVRMQVLQPVQYIVVDGGSDDSTLEIVRNYRDVFPVLELIAGPDKGIFDALNKGIGAARGDWLYFLGSDDRMADGRVLHEVSQYLDGYELVYGDVMLESGKVWKGPYTVEWLLDHNPCQQALFYHRSLFERFGAFSLKYPYAADYYFNFVCFTAPVKLRYVNRTIAIYNESGRSARFTDPASSWDRHDLIQLHARGKVSQGRYEAVLRREQQNQVRLALAEGPILRGLEIVLRLWISRRNLSLLRDALYVLRKRWGLVRWG